MKCEKCGHEIGLPIGDVKLDYEALYNEYPKRLGNQRKAHGLRYCAKNIKTKAKYDEVMGAIKKYHLHCLRERIVGTGFVCQFATFVNGVWEEWKQVGEPPKRLMTLDDLEVANG